MAQGTESKGPGRVTGPCILARPKRFELLTPWFVAKYSIQLSYGRFEGCGLYAVFALLPLPLNLAETEGLFGFALPPRILIPRIARDRPAGVFREPGSLTEP